MPVSSATSEGSFSAMRLMKSYSRSTMGDELVTYAYTQACASRPVNEY